MLHGPFRRSPAVRFMLRIGHGASRPCRSAFQGAFHGLSVSLRLSILHRRKSPPEPVSAVSCEDERCFTAHGSPFRCMLWRAPPFSNGMRARIVARSAGGSTGKKLALVTGNLGCPSSPFAVASSSVTAFASSVQYPPFRLVGCPPASVDAAMFLTAQVMIHILARMYC